MERSARSNLEAETMAAATANPFEMTNDWSVPFNSMGLSRTVYVPEGEGFIDTGLYFGPGLAVPPSMPIEKAARELGRILFTHKPGAAKETTCSICQDEISGKRSVEITPCGHKFHAGCLSRWTKDHNNHRCPMCRSDMFPNVRAARTDEDREEAEWRAAINELSAALDASHNDDDGSNSGGDDASNDDGSDDDASDVGRHLDIENESSDNEEDGGDGSGSGIGDGDGGGDGDGDGDGDEIDEALRRAGEVDLATLRFMLGVRAQLMAMSRSSISSDSDDSGLNDIELTEDFDRWLRE